MNKIKHICLLTFLILIGCSENGTEVKYDINYFPLIEPFEFNIDSLILYELSSPYKNNSTSEIEFRGIDSYSCTYDSLKGIEINMHFGMMNGETFSITMQNDSFITNHRSWGCTSHEFFRYETIKQRITLNSPLNKDTDTIIGQISYVGLQDIEHKIKQWEKYGENSDWLRELKPRVAKLDGQFKLRVYKYQSDHSEEFNRSFLFRKRQFRKDLATAYKTRSDSLNCSRMKLEKLPNGTLGVKSIRKLNLEGNSLNKYDFKELKSLPNLEKVYLGWNNFKEFPKNLIENDNITYVNLRGNPIETIPLENLMNSKIKYLNLEGSKLKVENLKQLMTKMHIEI